MPPKKIRVSTYFRLGKSQPYLDFVDVRLDTDIPAFVDPSAIRSLNSQWGNELTALLQNFFSCVLEHIRKGHHAKARELLSSLNERNEFHLGLSKGKSQGKGLGKTSAKSVWNELSRSGAAVTGLLKDLEDACLLIHGIGADLISDAVCNIVRGPLIKYTQDMCVYYNIPMVSDVDSGPIWNPHKEMWEDALVDLPMTKFGRLLLVPKVLVRHRFTYRSDDYYRHYLLPEMQKDEIRRGTSLVYTLKNGTKKVTKKSLMEKYGADKLAIQAQTKKHQGILDQYRRFKSKHPSPPLSHSKLAETQGGPKPDWTRLQNVLRKIPLGDQGAKAYEDVIESIFSALFYPALSYPKKQHGLHGRRKIVDLTYSNCAAGGFFNWLSLHYPSALIFVECKNYSNDPKNPELDQLAGRFSPGRGQVGILVCRKIDDKKTIIKRCVDTASDGRGYIIPLDDLDIDELIKFRIDNPDSIEFPLLREIMGKVIS